MYEQYIDNTNTDFAPRLLHLKFYKPNGYNDQYYRPFDIQTTNTVLSNVSNLVANNTTHFTPSTVAEIAADAIVMGDPESVVHIPNGWGTPRLMFLLTVEVRNLSNLTETMQIQGYTDYYDPSVTQAIALDARMVINGIVIMNTADRGTGLDPIIKIKSSNQCLTNAPDKQLYEVTPKSAITTLSVDKEIIPHSHYDNAVFVPSNTLDASMHTSTRDNLSPASWLSSTLNAHVDGLDATKTSLAASNGDMYDGASRYYTETLQMISRSEDVVYDNPFISILNNVTGSTGCAFTWGDLLRIDPTIDDRTDVFGANDHYIADSESMDTRDATGLAAEFAAQVTSAIMYRLAISEVSFAFNNLDVQNHTLTIFSYESMSGLVNNSITSNLHSSLLFELIPITTRNDTTLVSLSASCSVMHGSHIEISVNGGPTTPYVKPAFADSGASAMVSTTSMQHTTVAMNDILEATGMVNEITQTLSANSIEEPLSTAPTLQPNTIY